MVDGTEKVGGLRRFQVVTTFSAKGFADYGRRMLKSVEWHWPQDVPLIVYREGFDLPQGSRAIGRDLDAIHWLAEFKGRHRNNSAAHGKGRTGPYDFRHDAVRFAHKTAAVIHAGELALNANAADCLIWMDGDTLAHADMTQDVLESFMPEDKAIAWLWRTKSYPECGFYILNLRHPGVAGLLTTWRTAYETDGVFALRETHDSFVLQQMVERLGLQWHSLSGGQEDWHHPAASGPLANWIDHMKGDRKRAGRTPKSEARGRHTSGYWT